MPANPLKTPKPPSTPPYGDLAIQEHDFGVEDYLRGLSGMRPDIEIEGYGKQTWERDPVTGQPLNKVKLSQDPNIRKLALAGQGLAGKGMAGLTRMKFGGNKIKPEDIAKLGDWGKLQTNPLTAQADAFRRMQEQSAPDRAAADEALRTRIANAGGTGQAMDINATRQHEDQNARDVNQSQLDSYGIAEKLFGIDLGTAQFANQTRNSQFDELLGTTQQNQSAEQQKYNELGGLTNFGAPEKLSFPNYGVPGGPDSPDLVGAAGKGFEGDITNYNEDVARQQASQDAIMTAAGAAGV